MNRLSIGIPEISLRQLKAALYVANEKSVTNAAVKLTRSQTAITKAINDLEKTLNATLFDRTSTGMCPTAYCDALINRINQAQVSFSAAHLEYKKFRDGKEAPHSAQFFAMEISYKRFAAFIALFETREFTATAKLLNITKAAVYNSIRQIEDLLDLPLFEREPNSVKPTLLCAKMVVHIKLAFYQIRHAIEDIASLKGATEGQVIIGTLPYTRTYLIPNAINGLLEKHADIDVTTQEAPYINMENSLRCGDLDFIIGAIRPEQNITDIVTEELFQDRLSIIARKNHPLANKTNLTKEELQELHWILPTKLAPSRHLFDETMTKYGVNTPQHVIETSSLSIIRGLLLNSDRVALLSEHQIHYDKLYNVLDILPVKLGETYRPIGVTMRSKTQHSPAAKLFLEELREAAKNIASLYD